MSQYAPNPISSWDGIGPYAADEATKEDPFVSHFSMMALPKDPESALAEVKKRRARRSKGVSISEIGHFGGHLR